MKRLLLAPLLISVSFLNMGFIGKPKLEALYCSGDKYLNISKDEMWKNYPWIFDNKTGKLYNYDPFLNQIDPLKTDKIGDELFTYDSRLDGNILKIREVQTSSGYVIEERRYAIDIKARKSTHYAMEYLEKKSQDSCIKLNLPKGVKINY